MRTRIALAAAAALATTLATAPGALAAGAVYGGTTSRGEAIVIKADKSGKKLRSAVIAWNADCGDQSYLARGSSVTATKASPGFAPDSAVLETSRNGKGRFAGKQTMALGNDTSTAAVAVTLDGRLGKKAASGTLSAVATITDVASGSTVGTCATGRLTWRATHAPGRVYAGRTTQDEPVVVRLDVKRKRVTDLFVSWDSQSC